MKYKNRSNPSLVVDVVEIGELRTGEIKEPVICYRKPGGKLTIRRKAEFLRMFEPSA